MTATPVPPPIQPPYPIYQQPQTFEGPPPKVKDASNYLFFLAGLQGVAATVMTVVLLSQRNSATAVEPGAVVALAVLGVLCAVTIWSGVMVRGGRGAGRVLGTILGALVLLNIPIGTLIGLGLLTKLHSKEASAYFAFKKAQRLTAPTDLP